MEKDFTITSEFYNNSIITTIGDYHRVYKPNKGDEIWIRSDGNRPKIGDKWNNVAITVRLDYKPKKWWQFWKNKELIGYVVKWL